MCISKTKAMYVYNKVCMYVVYVRTVCMYNKVCMYVCMYVCPRSSPPHQRRYPHAHRRAGGGGKRSVRQRSLGCRHVHEKCQAEIS